MAYRDSDDEAMGDLAYFGKVQGLSDHVFLQHDATDRIHRVVDAIAREQAAAPTSRTRRGGGGPMTHQYAVRDEPYLRRDKRRSLKMDEQRPFIFQEIQSQFKPPQGRGGSSGDRRGGPNPDTVRAKQLREALGPVYAWNGSSYNVDTGKLDGAKTAAVIMQVAEKGPKRMIEGAGSRLPDPQGTIFTLGDIPRARIFEILGVDEEPDGTFTNVKVKALDRDKYVDELDMRIDAKENVFSLAWAPTNTFMFYASTVDPSATSNRVIQINGTVYTVEELADPTLSPVVVSEMDRAFAAFKVGDDGWIPGTQLQAARGRETGQNLAMANWNAKGAAAYANRFLGGQLDLAQDWEWLHLRGAQIGGVTANGNLVPGLFSSNSAMIPYEARIKNWAIEDAKHFEAKFEGVGGRGVVVEKIVLKVRGISLPGEKDVFGNATGHQSLGVQERTLLVFDPLHGRVVDKMGDLFIRRKVDFGFV
jgi:hypothetical protein